MRQHLKLMMNDPAYRALHRFERQIGGHPRFQNGMVNFSGRNIRFCDNASFLSAWDEIYFNRIYEIEDGEAPLLVDAGANIGLAALFWKSRFPSFRYLGFEPDPKIAAICRANLDEWDVNGELHEVALGSDDGRGSFIADGADAGHLVPSLTGDSGLSVRVERLSSHLSEAVDLLKIDIEGSELAVISEIRSRLHLVRRIFVEWHSTTMESTSLGKGIGLLESEGFEVFVQVVSGPPRPFRMKPERDSASQNLNLYGVRP